MWEHITCTQPWKDHIQWINSKLSTWTSLYGGAGSGFYSAVQSQYSIHVLLMFSPVEGSGLVAFLPTESCFGPPTPFDAIHRILCYRMCTELYDSNAHPTSASSTSYIKYLPYQPLTQCISHYISAWIEMRWRPYTQPNFGLVRNLFITYIKLIRCDSTTKKSAILLAKYLYTAATVKADPTREIIKLVWNFGWLTMRFLLFVCLLLIAQFVFLACWQPTGS